MKKLLFIFFYLMIYFTNAQEKVIVGYEFKNEGIVEDESNLHDKKVSQKVNYNELYFQLITSKDESVFNKIEKIDNSQGKSSGFSVSFVNGPAGKFYKNLKTFTTLEEVNMNGKDLLINDVIKKQNWILSKESAKIIGFDVKKAELFINENSKVYAWYAPKLNFKNGPSEYEGLPGLILKLELFNKEDNKIYKQVYSAIDLKLDYKTKLEKPTKGKSITKAEFEEIIKEEERKFNEIFKQ